MDFVFAGFPWLITRELKINRGEKIGLCITMSLGMMYDALELWLRYKLTLCSVAIVSAIRVGWKDEGNDRDRWYICKLRCHHESDDLLTRWLFQTEMVYRKSGT